MTDLQLSLMAFGGTIVIGVFSYNKWQEFKTRRAVERAFSSTHDDVLMRKDSIAGSTPTRTEPSFEAASADAALADGVHGDSGTTQGAAQFIETPSPADLPIDPLIDCIIPLELAMPVRGDKILALSQSLRHVGNKPVHFIACTEDGKWEALSHGSVYMALQAGVQLANRQSALNEIEYSELVSRLGHIAEALDAELDLPDMAAVIQTARSLHQFVTDCYAQLSVNVLSRAAPWNVETLLGALRRQGFDVRPDGRLVMSDGEMGPLFTLSTNLVQGGETTTLLTLLLEVPCVAPSRDGFGALVGCARMLAGRLEGIVVDDSSQPLTDEAIAEIAAQVTSFYEHMEASEIPAGSTRALRLFA
jgi:hypothetical protein